VVPWLAQSLYRAYVRPGHKPPLVSISALDEGLTDGGHDPSKRPLASLTPLVYDPHGLWFLADHPHRFLDLSV
jgi:hypothetical protein